MSPPLTLNLTPPISPTSSSSSFSRPPPRLLSAKGSVLLNLPRDTLPLSLFEAFTLRRVCFRLNVYRELCVNVTLQGEIIIEGEGGERLAGGYNGSGFDEINRNEFHRECLPR